MARPVASAVRDQRRDRQRQHRVRSGVGPAACVGPPHALSVARGLQRTLHERSGRASRRRGARAESPAGSAHARPALTRLRTHRHSGGEASGRPLVRLGQPRRVDPQRGEGGATAARLDEGPGRASAARAFGPAFSSTPVIGVSWRRPITRQVQPRLPLAGPFAGLVGHYADEAGRWPLCPSAGPATHRSKSRWDWRLG
jgi:hypothetical protein